MFMIVYDCLLHIMGLLPIEHKQGILTILFINIFYMPKTRVPKVLFAGIWSFLKSFQRFERSKLFLWWEKTYLLVFSVDICTDGAKAMVYETVNALVRIKA